MAIPKEEKDKTRQALTFMKALALASTVSVQIAVPIVGGFFAGRFFDYRLGTEPWLMLAGLFLGLAAGVVGVVRIIQRVFRE